MKSFRSLAVVLCLLVIASPLYGDSPLIPRTLAIYYGYPSLVNGSAGTLASAIDVFNDYGLVVFGDGLQSALHPDHGKTMSIIGGLKTSPNNTAVYGYIPIGVSNLVSGQTALAIVEIKERVDAWALMGVKGIFFDQGGYDFGVSRQRQNEAVDYVHSLGLSVFMNAWNPDDVFSPSPGSLNPEGASTSLGESDYYLLESFQVQWGQYQDPPVWVEKSDKAAGYQSQYNTRMATVTTTGGSAFSQEQSDYAWWSTLLYGFDAMGWGELYFSASDNNLPSRTRPSPGVLGSGFASPVTHASPLHTRATTAGMIEVNDDTHTGTFTADIQTLTITWTNPFDVGYGTPLSDTQLNATVTEDGAPVSGTFAYTPAAGTVLDAGAGQTLSVTFTPTDTTRYTSATATVTITVVKATPTITWPSPVDIPHGTPLNDTQLNATANVPGSFLYSPAAGTVLDVGSRQLSVTFTPANTGNYTTATASVTLVVNQAGVTVALRDSNGNPLSGGVVQYYFGGWQPFGTTDADGKVSKALAPKTYTFSVGYAYGRQEKAQNVATAPTVVFQTKAVTVELRNSAGTLIAEPATVQYYAGGWRDFGAASTGQVTKELLPLTYTFSMNYAYGRQDKAQNVATAPTVVFQTKAVTVELRNSAGALIAEPAAVQYYAGGWRVFGTASTGQVTKELLPLTYTFSMNYAYGRQDKAQNVATAPTVVFQTKAVTVELRNSAGTLIAEPATVQYYAGGWRVFGAASTGQVTKELLPLTYTFSMNYAYGRQEKAQHVATAPTVVFQTKAVTVELRNSAGALIAEPATVQYYTGGWRVFGVASAGQVTKELLPLTYTFSMNYAYGRQEKAQNVATAPTVVFQTKAVTVELRNSAGALIAEPAAVQYYAGGWRVFGAASTGQVTKELLPLTYTFSMNYAYGRQEKAQNVAANPTAGFRTGAVHSDTGTCTRYYAGGWRAFSQDMELLPLRYTFHFDNGTPDRSYAIASATATHIQ